MYIISIILLILVSILNSSKTTHLFKTISIKCEELSQQYTIPIITVFSPVTLYFNILSNTPAWSEECLNSVLELLGDSIPPSNSQDKKLFNEKYSTQFENKIFENNIPYDLLSTTTEELAQNKSFYHSQSIIYEGNDHKIINNSNNTRLTGLTELRNTGDKKNFLDTRKIYADLSKQHLGLLDAYHNGNVSMLPYDIKLSLASLFFSSEHFRKYEYGQNHIAFRPKNDSPSIRVRFTPIRNSNLENYTDVYLVKIPISNNNSKKDKQKILYLAVSFFDLTNKYFGNLNLGRYLHDVIKTIINTKKVGDYNVLGKIFNNSEKKEWPDKYFIPSLSIKEVISFNRILATLIGDIDSYDCLKCHASGSGYDIIDIFYNKVIDNPSKTISGNFYSENVLDISDKGIKFASVFTECFKLTPHKVDQVHFNNKGMFISVLMEGKEAPEVLFTSKVMGMHGEDDALKEIGITDATVKMNEDVIANDTIISGKDVKTNGNRPPKGIWFTLIIFGIMFCWLCVGMWRVRTKRARYIAEGLFGRYIARRVLGYVGQKNIKTSSKIK